MGRKRSTIEVLERLVEWAGGRASFRQKTGIQSSNLSDYLNGNKSITFKRLRQCAQHIFGEPPAFEPILEGYDVAIHGRPTVAQLPRESGIYALFDSAMRVLYYGKATNLFAEVRQTLNRRVAEVRPWTGAKNLSFATITKFILAHRIVRGDSKFVHDVEAFGLRILVNNTFNKNAGKFKRTK